MITTGSFPKALEGGRGGSASRRTPASNDGRKKPTPGKQTAACNKKNK